MNHAKIKTWCDRPDDFTERIDDNVMRILKAGDLLLDLGDFGIGKPELYVATAKKWRDAGIIHVLIRGNHDQKSCQWYMEHGFSFACDAMIYRGAWLTHHPWKGALPEGTNVNIHGHLHNVWHGFGSDDPEAEADQFKQATREGHLANPWQRLFAVEYTDYMPIEFDHFLAKPDKYQARGPKKKLLPEGWDG
jgi:calcineurin-like phosphoesterase family protein